MREGEGKSWTERAGKIDKKGKESDSENKHHRSDEENKHHKSAEKYKANQSK